MARKSLKPEATSFEVLDCVQKKCPSCGQTMWNEYNNPRHIRTLNGVVELQLKIRRCQNKLCLRYKKAYRPEQEGSLALPQNEFGLDVIAYIGALRYQEYRSVPQIHAHLELKGICISQRTVTHLIDRYDELLSLWLKDHKRLKAIVKKQGRVILAIDGMQPEIGHEVLWVIRDCLSGEILLAKTLLSSRNEDLVALLLEVTNTLNVPIDGVVSDGQQSIRKVVGLALPRIAHGLCHYHYLKEAIKPIYEADRHAKKELKKKVRGLREIERSVTNEDQDLVTIIEDYCSAVRSSITNDGHPPLEASGLNLQENLTLIEQSLERMEKRSALPPPLVNLKHLLAKVLSATASLFSPVRVAYEWVDKASNILNNKIGLDAAGVKHSYHQLLTEISQQKQKASTLNTAIDNFIKTTHNYWSGLFHCYEIEGFPRTNNDLEHAFGMLRHHQRRCTGRKVAPSSLVIRGSVKLACAIATKLHSFTASDLAQVDIHTWLELRSQLQKHNKARIEQYRFRRDPKAYLANLESRLL